MSYFPEDIGLDRTEMVKHAHYCKIVQTHELWAYVDVIRLFLSEAGFISCGQYERMLDIEFVATHYRFLPNDGAELLELYIEWLQRQRYILRETKKQCQNLMINTSFTKQ